MSGRFTPDHSLKTSSFTRKSLEPIKEESIGSSTELKSRSKKSLQSPPGGKPSKPCPFTNDICPAKAAFDEQRRVSYISGDSSMYSDARKSYSSILERPFIFRRASSLQRAVVQDEARQYLAQVFLPPVEEEGPGTEDLCSTTFTETIISTTETERYSDTKSQTESTEEVSAEFAKKRLQYLMGLTTEAAAEEGPRMVDHIEQVAIEDAEELTGETEAMKQAQRYLRVHRIFEFYQFLVAHLLSAVPENPINFLLDLLDRCIIYRAGMGNPPVLYDRKHLRALFNLMDRMRTGYIDKDQYVTGMKTLGVCSYKPDPPTTDGMVHIDFFIEEAYENLVSLLNDIIRRRWIYFTNQPFPMKTPPPTPQFSTRSSRVTDVSTKHTSKTATSSILRKNSAL